VSAPVSAPASSAEHRDQHAGARAALALGALGVVFGDLGTSPLYTVQTVFNPSDPHPVPVVKNNIYGVICGRTTTARAASWP
jgi:KUP system potassium uptake protein